MSSNEPVDKHIKWVPAENQFRIRVALKDPRTGLVSNRKGIAADRRSALELRDRLVEEIRTGLRQTNDDPTLGEFAASWLGRKLPRIPSKTTQLRYGDEIRLHILGEFTTPRVCLGKLRVRAIRKDDLDDWFLAMTNANANLHRQRARDELRAKKSAALVAAGRPALKPLPPMRAAAYSHATINGAWRTLKQILQDAVHSLQLTLDPTLQIDPLPEAKRTRAKANTLTFDEVHRIFIYAKEHRPYWFAFMAVGFNTGTRLGELKPLRWDEDVDLKKGTILIQQSQRGDHLGETKGKEDREMPLPPELVEILRGHREWLRINHPGASSGLVFPGYGGWRPWHKTRPMEIEKSFLSKGAFDKPLRDMCKAVGITKYISTKAMRRTFNTLCDELKIEASVTRSISGHKTEEMRMLYTDVREPRRREALGKLARLFSIGGDKE